MNYEEETAENGHRNGNVPYDVPQYRVLTHRHYWIGFDDNGKQRWFFMLNNGRVISQDDESYNMWYKRYYANKRRFETS